MDNKQVPISFAMLAGTSEIYRIDDKIIKTKENIEKFIDKVIKFFCEKDPENEYKNNDPSFFFVNHYNNQTLYDYKDTINSMTSSLMEKEYYVRNRVSKYYVIAFAINYTRFEIYSKDCDKELISWNNDNNGPIKGIINDLDYNVNPVIKLIKSLNC